MNLIKQIINKMLLKNKKSVIVTLNFIAFYETDRFLKIDNYSIHKAFNEWINLQDHPYPSINFKSLYIMPISNFNINENLFQMVGKMLQRKVSITSLGIKELEITFKFTYVNDKTDRSKSFDMIETMKGSDQASQTAYIMKEFNKFGRPDIEILNMEESCPMMFELSDFYNLCIPSTETTLEKVLEYWKYKDINSLLNDLILMNFDALTRKTGLNKIIKSYTPNGLKPYSSLLVRKYFTDILPETGVALYEILPASLGNYKTKKSFACEVNGYNFNLYDYFAIVKKENEKDGITKKNKRKPRTKN